MLRQKLLVMWANYWLHHVLKVAAEAVVAVAMVGGTVTTVVAVTPISHHKPTVHKPAPVVSVTKPKPVVKKQVAAPPPKPVSAPVAAPAPAPTPPPSPAPKPIATTQPSPGSGVKKLVPTSSAGTSTSSSSSTTTASGTTTTAPTSTTTAPALATGGYYSTNWSGYAAMQGTFTSVSGSWIVPTVSGNGSTTSGDAAWIGIGGATTSDLIQTGTDNEVAADGTVSSFAFYELLPDPALEITSLKVHAGDVMNASISQLAGGQWNITITDTTTSKSYTTTVSYTSSYSSAEWIEEDPSYVDGSLVPFDSFDHVEFTSGATTMNGASVSIDGSNAAPITLVDSKNSPIVTPSVLINSGTAFWAIHN